MQTPYRNIRHSLIRAPNFQTPKLYRQKKSSLSLNMTLADITLNLSLGPLPKAGRNTGTSLRLWFGTVNHLLGDVP